MKDFICKYFEEEKKILDKISLNNIVEMIKILQSSCKRGGLIFVFGNGGSGSTASHFACDMNKGTCSGFKVICLNDNTPIILAYANDVSFEEIFVEQLRHLAKPGDIVFAISGSGKSANILKAVHYANDNKLISIALSGFDGGELVKIADTSIIVPSTDMQKIEDLHLILVHVIMQFFDSREKI